VELTFRHFLGKKGKKEDERTTSPRENKGEKKKPKKEKEKEKEKSGKDKGDKKNDSKKKASGSSSLAGDGSLFFIVSTVRV
jgi:hypothetical protein